MWGEAGWNFFHKRTCFTWWNLIRADICGQTNPWWDWGSKCRPICKRIGLFQFSLTLFIIIMSQCLDDQRLGQTSYLIFWFGTFSPAYKASQSFLSTYTLPCSSWRNKQVDVSLIRTRSVSCNCCKCLGGRCANAGCSSPRPALQSVLCGPLNFY